MADLLTLGERVAIVGGAGSGKTTFLSFVAVSLAAALRG
jgi:ABC-type transport system involved in cytochrome bd biosynthesis fused ATPase/permease subunit